MTTEPTEPTEPVEFVSAEHEVVDLVSRLIQFDTSNTGEASTTKGEAECAAWVADRLAEVGYEPEIIESGAPGRANVIVRLKGRDHNRGALLIHGHLDVVPAAAADWSVHPFSGAVQDGYVWGRGAVDMKDMDGMMLAVAREFRRTGYVPPRDLVFAFVADEEAGGEFGAHWLVKHRPELFEGVTEAIGEVGGFSLSLPDRQGELVRFYLIEAAEKGLGWMRVTAGGTAGHGSFISDDNAVTTLAAAVARVGQHEFPLVITDTVSEFLHRISDATGIEFDLDAPDLGDALAKLGPMSRMLGATLRDTANPTMLRAGYKANVIPQTAEAVIDCRIVPGRQAAFERELDELLGPDVSREWITRLDDYETTFDGDLVEAMNNAILKFDPDAHTVPYMLSGGTDAKAFASLGIRCFGFAPLRLPPDLDFTALFHGVDERVPVDALKFGTHVLREFLHNS